MSGLFACAKEKYKLILNDGFLESAKREYESGEEVRVTYNFIASDTDYRFLIDEDVKMKQDYDPQDGYILTFNMPRHDVSVSVQSRNTMTIDPNAHRPDPAYLIDEERILFDYCEQTLTAGQDSMHYELVLYESDMPGKMILAEYIKENERVPETCRAISVDEEVYERCLQIAEEFPMMKGKDEAESDGKRYTVRFRNSGQDCDLIRITSDQVEGRDTFDKIRETLASAGSGLKEAEGVWICPECGAKNEGKFCSECGRRKQEP